MNGEKCGGNCKNGQEERCVPFFDVQNTMMHYNWANRRMLIALIAICVTMIAEEAEVDVSTVKRVINRNSYIYKYLPESDPRLSRK